MIPIFVFYLIRVRLGRGKNSVCLRCFGEASNGISFGVDPSSRGELCKRLCARHPRVATNANRAVIARHDYHPFGEEIVTYPENITSKRTPVLGYSSDDVRKESTGYERDKEVKLDFAQAWTYWYSVGRFTAPDEFFYAANTADPQSLSLYVYVRNRPLVFTDPTGKFLRTLSIVRQEIGLLLMIFTTTLVISATTSEINRMQFLWKHNTDGRSTYYKELREFQRGSNSLHMTPVQFTSLAKADMRKAPEV